MAAVGGGDGGQYLRVNTGIIIRSKGKIVGVVQDLHSCAFLTLQEYNTNPKNKLTALAHLIVLLVLSWAQLKENDLLRH